MASFEQLYASLKNIPLVCLSQISQTKTQEKCELVSTTMGNVLNCSNYIFFYIGNPGTGAFKETTELLQNFIQVKNKALISNK
jgi:hypothetical protein